jgi:hypothetical protein
MKRRKISPPKTIIRNFKSLFSNPNLKEIIPNKKLNDGKTTAKKSDKKSNLPILADRKRKIIAKENNTGIIEKRK